MLLLSNRPDLDSMIRFRSILQFFSQSHVSYTNGIKSRTSLLSGGMCFAYNCDLYYREYFPDYDLGWWLFTVTIVIGSIGVVVGGIVSDKIVAKMGIRSRVACLAISQIIATPPAFGSVYFNPLWAMITLGFSYFFGKERPRDAQLTRGPKSRRDTGANPIFNSINHTWIRPR